MAAEAEASWLQVLFTQLPAIIMSVANLILVIRGQKKSE